MPPLIAVAAMTAVILAAAVVSLTANWITSGGGPVLRHYAGASFSLDYPSDWRVIRGLAHYGIDGPTIVVALGTGDYDLGCTVTANSVACQGSRWVVPSSGVVVAYYYLSFLRTHPQPTPSLGPGERWVDVGGRAAVLAQTATSMLWHFPGAPEFIEARWGAANAERSRAEVETMIARWRWK
jgi:hypothetical protein